MKKKILKSISIFVMFCFSLLYLIPIWMIMVNSLKVTAEANLLSIGLPSDLVFHFENYAKVIKEAGVVRAFFNGVIEASLSVLLIVFAASAASFVISRRKSRTTNFLFYIFILGLIIPVALTPTYLVLDRLNLLNTYAGIILVFTTYGLPMSIFLYTGFIKTIPRELDEAATIDGCGPVGLFFKIIFPLLKPVTMTVFILSFVGAWNDVMIPLFFANGDKWALPLTVYNYYGAYMKSWNYIFADIIITITPLLILYIFAQKYIVSGMTAGAVKG